MTSAAASEPSRPANLKRPALRQAKAEPGLRIGRPPPGGVHDFLDRDGGGSGEWVGAGDDHRTLLGSGSGAGDL